MDLPSATVPRAFQLLPDRGHREDGQPTVPSTRLMEAPQDRVDGAAAEAGGIHDAVDTLKNHVYNVSMPDLRALGIFEQQILLAVLQAGENAYPPLILQKLEDATGRPVSRGSVYVTLDRLEKKELLTSTPGPREPERGGHPKRFVSLTEAGLVALRETRKSLIHFLSDLDAVLEP